MATYERALVAVPCGKYGTRVCNLSVAPLVVIFGRRHNVFVVCSSWHNVHVTTIDDFVVNVGLLKIRIDCLFCIFGLHYHSENLGI
jgi:hypothetical protein